MIKFCKTLVHLDRPGVKATTDVEEAVTRESHVTISNTNVRVLTAAQMEDEIEESREGRHETQIQCVVSEEAYPLEQGQFHEVGGF